MTDIVEQPDLLTGVTDEADLCRNEGAQDIADLLDEVAKEITSLRAHLTGVSE